MPTLIGLRRMSQIKHLTLRTAPKIFGILVINSVPVYRAMHRCHFQTLDLGCQIVAGLGRAVRSVYGLQQCAVRTHLGCSSSTPPTCAIRVILCRHSLFSRIYHTRATTTRRPLIRIHLGIEFSAFIKQRLRLVVF